MQTTPTLATNKIILAAAFISAALMASLFVFHMSHKTPAHVQINSENALIFPLARDVKPFDLVTAENKPFTLNDFRDHWTLLFFGFTHCSSICPTTLDLLNKVYGELHSAYPNLQVALISLDPERDTRARLSQYVHSYHPDFIGASGKIENVRKLQSQLGIYSARDNAADYQIQHTSSIILINPEGKWAGLFKFGIKPAELIDVFKKNAA